MTTPFPALFSPIRIGPVELKNRVLSTAHQTSHVHDHLPTPSFIAYHRERAKGGVGLIVLEAHAVLSSAVNTAHSVDMSREEIVPIYRELMNQVSPYGTRVFVQIGHTGAEVYPGDYAPPPASVSALPTDRFKLVPRALEREEIGEIIQAMGAAAARAERAGLNGVELLGSHGYLISQFWSARGNARTDEYGGSFENRMRFVLECLAAVRRAVGRRLAVGIRMSIDEMDGLGVDEMLPIARRLEATGELDYINAVAGTSRNHYGCTYIVPPPAVDRDEIIRIWRALRAAVRLPLLGASRVHRPEEAEAALAEGYLDVVGMTRALISDPHLPNKARDGRLDEILYCIGCNQSCIGRYQQGLSLHCLQNPVTGREEQYADLPPAERPKRVIVVGGGPGGLKAAAVAARRGHRVLLWEKDRAVGGAARLVAGVPGRDFALLADNLRREAERAGVEFRLGAPATAAGILAEHPDAVILATGAEPGVPDWPADGIAMATVHAALAGEAAVGERVLIADWRGDWQALDAGIALARRGHRVTIVTAGYVAGEAVQQYIRHKALQAAYELGITLVPHYRVVGAARGRVRLQNLFTLAIEERDGFDTLLLALAGRPRTELWGALKGQVPELHRIGDCLSPRSAEEAVLEGFEIAARL